MREVTGLHLKFYHRDVTDGTLSPCNFPQSSQEVVKFAQKPENAVQPVIGLGLRSSAGRTSTIVRRGGFLGRVRQQDGYGERWLDTERVYQICECTVVWRVVKEAKAECAIVLRTPGVINVCERNVPSGFRAHSSIPKSEASVLLDTTKSAKKWMVEPPATWVGSLFGCCTSFFLFYVGVGRVETVVGQVCARVMLHSNLPT